MKKNIANICKFSAHSSSERITTSNFVFETHADRINKRSMSSYNIMYLVVSGKGYLCTEYRREELLPGTLFFTLSGNSFSIENTEDIQYMYISFSGLRSEELFKRFGISLANCTFKGHEGLVSFWQNCLNKANEETVDLMSESVLLYSFSQMSLHSERGEQHLIAEMLRFIEANFTASELTLEDVGKELGYSPKYLSRVFKTNLCVSFSEYLKNTRIQHATFLMEQGITTVKNVAILSGYKDPLYFSNVFKKTVGISPTEFIKRKEKDN